MIGSAGLAVSLILTVCAQASAKDAAADPIVEIGGVSGGSSTLANAPASSSDTGNTAEIPQSQPAAPPETTVDQEPAAASPAGANPGRAIDPATAQTNRAIEEYQAAQNPNLPAAPHLHSLQEFLNADTDSSPIGVELREDHRRLGSGEEADGLLIVKVHHGSPAAQAGLRAYRTTGHSLMEAAAVLATLVFPPAVLAIAALDSTHIGESYDMIIGVDGRRVTNYVDFEDQTRAVRPGDVVYLSIVRNGRRMQVRVPIPATYSAAQRSLAY